MKTLVDLFTETCARLPRKRALVWQDRSWAFEEVREQARRIAGALVRRDLRRTDRVAIFLPNGPETLFTHLAVPLAGGIRVPVNSAYTEREALHPVDFTSCRWIITDDVRRPLAERIARACTEPPCVATVLELLEGHSSLELPSPPLPEEVSAIGFTSGTSGKPKGVPLTHANLVSNILALAEVWEWTDRDILLLCLPLMHFHALGNGFNGWIATGCTLVLQEKFQPEEVLAALERHRCTLFFGVPAMYHRLLETSARSDLSSMRLWVSGSAPLDRTLQERFETAFGHRILNRYGMTETLMITSNPTRGERRVGSVGRALPGMDVRIFDLQAPRERSDGEVVVRGPSLTSGYWRGEKDEATRMEGGFFRTGDIGYRDRDGYFFITGRAKDIIISGGTNIAPLEIEEVLLGHPGVREAVAVPIPDPALGEIIRAVVVPKRGTSLRPEDIADWCGSRLAKFKRPRDVRVVDGPIPRNALQKLDRKRAREIYG